MLLSSKRRSRRRDTLLRIVCLCSGRLFPSRYGFFAQNKRLITTMVNTIENKA